MTLCRRPAKPSSQPREEGEANGNPNRRLLLGLAISFTVVRALLWLGLIPDLGLITVITNALPNLEKAVNSILVLSLSKGLQQELAGWLPVRRSTSLPLQDK